MIHEVKTRKTVLRSADLAQTETTTQRVGPPQLDDATHERMKVFRENGHIQKIEITCNCGEKIQVRCEYE